MPAANLVAVAILNLILGEAAPADTSGTFTIAPEEAIACKKGEVKVLDDKGTHCEVRECASRMACPAGWACVARKEKVCPASTSSDQACTDTVTKRRCQVAKLQPPRCPAGAKVDRKRTERLMARLRNHPSSASLASGLGQQPIVCYGHVAEGEVTDDDAIVLQRDRPETAQTARLAHLLSHLTLWAPFAKDAIVLGEQSCQEAARNATGAEEAASELENEMRQSFDLPALPVEDVRDKTVQRCEALRRK